jgi:TonB family protein
MLNQTIQTYQVKKEIGRGGMATVYLGENSIGKKVAIKVLEKKYFHDEQIKKRFIQEAKLMVSLEHDNICQVNALEDNDEYCAIIMEYLEGQDLGSYVNKKGAVSEKVLLGWLEQMADAMDYAHSEKVVHRDIKPSNFFLTKKGQVKIMDFGIAKQEENMMGTRTDSKMGSVIYMSPEQIQSPKYVDYKTDIYSLGVALYHLSTGNIPYDIGTESEFAVMSSITQKPLPDLSDRNSRINAIIQAATKKDPKDRPNKVVDLLSVKPQMSDATVIEIGVGEKDLAEEPVTEANKKEESTAIEDGYVPKSPLGQKGKKIDQTDDKEQLKSNIKEAAIEAPLKSEVHSKANKNSNNTLFIIGALVVVLIFFWGYNGYQNDLKIDQEEYQLENLKKEEVGQQEIDRKKELAKQQELARKQEEDRKQEQIRQQELARKEALKTTEESSKVELDLDVTEEEVVEDFVFGEAPEEEVFTIVEDQPTFPGGNTAFYKFIGHNMTYPSQARRMGIEGRVIVQFVVDKDGSVSDVKVVKGIGAGCDEEAERVLKLSPKWSPGKERGRSVKVRMVLPIIFKLNEVMKTISGVVYYKNNKAKTTVADVAINLKGSEQRTKTDLYGQYNITVPKEGGTLVFKFIDGTSQEIVIGAREIVNVYMR